MPKPEQGLPLPFISHLCIVTIATYYSLQLGFDSLFFARIDYQDRAIRLRDKTLEVIWQGSKSLASSSQVSSFRSSYSHLCFTFIAHSTIFEFIRPQIFTGVFPRHYDPPDGFVFEINDVSPPIQVSLAKEFTFMQWLNYDTLEHHFHMGNLIEG